MHMSKVREKDLQEIQNLKDQIQEKDMQIEELVDANAVVQELEAENQKFRALHPDIEQQEVQREIDQKMLVIVNNEKLNQKLRDIVPNEQFKDHK